MQQQLIILKVEELESEEAIGEEAIGEEAICEKAIGEKAKLTRNIFYLVNKNKP